jgi:hypothetical protein
MDDLRTPTPYQQAIDRLMTEAVLSIDDAAIILKVDRKSAFKAASKGQIPTVQVGTLKKIPSAKFRAMLGLSVETAQVAA